MILLFPAWIILLLFFMVFLRKKKKMTLTRIVVVSLLVLLLFPSVIVGFKDGGTYEIWAPAYQIISWNLEDKGPNEPGYQGWEIHVFPANYHRKAYWESKNGY